MHRFSLRYKLTSSSIDNGGGTGVYYLQMTAVAPTLEDAIKSGRETVVRLVSGQFAKIAHEFELITCTSGHD